jgi:hypothetical protein
MATGASCFRSVDRIDKVTKADIKRVANATFYDTNRTVGVIETAKGAGQSGGHGSGDQGSGDQGPSDQGAAQ